MTNLQSKPLTFRSKTEQRLVFFFVAVGITALTYGFFYVIDFLPEKPGSETTETDPTLALERETRVEEEAPIERDTAVENPYPVKIFFDTLDRSATVVNPQSSDIATLDAALLGGVVRHPDSADFANTGTMFLLGHSSHLPVVQNKNFQAFNDIEKLEWGDTIRVHSVDTEYVYRVDRVYEAKASAAEVPLQFEEARLVLATCNSFGGKDDRFIVEARLVNTRAL
jgi:LPXTG-site transpeptidase (sortase) family protein